MPFLDAKALETDPEGMAFLRAVIGPKNRRKQPAPRPLATADQAQTEVAPLCAAEGANPAPFDTPHPLETA